MKKKANKTNIAELLKSFEMASSFGFSIALPISLGTILGAFLDAKTGLKPYFTLSLLILGLIISLYNSIQMVKKVMEKKNV